MTAYYLALLTALLWGIVPILEKVGLRQAPPLAGLAVRSAGVILGLLFLLIFSPPWPELAKMPPKTIVCLLSAGLLASFIAQIAFYHALKVGQVSMVVPISGSYPLIAFILGILILGEKLTLAKTFGAAFVIAGIFLLK